MASQVSVANTAISSVGMALSAWILLDHIDKGRSSLKLIGLLDICQITITFFRNMVFVIYLNVPNLDCQFRYYFASILTQIWYVVCCYMLVVRARATITNPRMLMWFNRVVGPFAMATMVGAGMYWVVIDNIRSENGFCKAKFDNVWFAVLFALDVFWDLVFSINYIATLGRLVRSRTQFKVANPNRRVHNYLYQSGSIYLFVMIFTSITKAICYNIKDLDQVAALAISHGGDIIKAVLMHRSVFVNKAFREMEQQPETQWQVATTASLHKPMGANTYSVYSTTGGFPEPKNGSNTSI